MSESTEIPNDKLTFIHVKIEDILVDMRDHRISQFTCCNGLSIREKDGKSSQIIRLGTREAVRQILELSERYDNGERLELQAHNDSVE